MTQKANGPASAPTLPSHGSSDFGKEIEMNEQAHTTAAPPVSPRFLPADDVNRAKAIVLTVWFALHAKELEADSSDVAAVSDTLYEAYERLSRAEKAMGVHHG